MSRPRLRATVALLAVAVTAAAVLAAPALAQPPLLALDPLVQGPDRPTGIYHAGDGSGRLFLVSKLGTIHIFDGDELLPTPFLNITARVNSDGSERGLHGLAFHPDYPSNGTFFVTYTDLDSDSNLARFSVSPDPDRADPTTEETILFIEQPQQWHNVSQLAFAADGTLYIGSGDGGFVGDPDNRAQNLGDLLGKILRIDVDGGFPYAIPPDNPFVDDPSARPEIWAYGVRNPWRFSFDRATGDLFMGDVGQGDWEEVNHQPADSPGGENYGWRIMEGNHCFNPPSDCDMDGLVLPIAEYPHFDDGFFGCAVIGGFRYRGERFPRFAGRYFYGDNCTGKIWTADDVSGAWQSVLVLDSALSITTFGEEPDGELLVADDLDGTIYRLVDPRPFCDFAPDAGVYGDGDVVTAAEARLVNLGQQGVSARVQVGLLPPDGAPIPFFDRTATLASGLERDFAPLALRAIEPGDPRGEWLLACRLVDPASGQVVFEQGLPFVVE